MSRPVVFGCDVSTEKIAVVSLTKSLGIEAVELFSSKTGPRGGRRKDLLSLVDAFKSYLVSNADAKSLIVIEGLPWVQNRNGIVSFGMVLGAMQYACHSIGIQSVIVDGKQWKKAIGLNGNATKTDIMNHVLVESDLLSAHRKALEEVGTQDILDAYCIAKYGMNLVEVRDDL